MQSALQTKKKFISRILNLNVVLVMRKIKKTLTVIQIFENPFSLVNCVFSVRLDRLYS